MAGIVTEKPSKPLDLMDLHPNGSETGNVPLKHGLSVNIAGLRIEPLPSPNSDDKNMSKQHTYTSLRLIRPFTFWRTCLHGIPETEWHPSIHNALAASATISLIDRQQFKGVWPNTDIYSRGIFIGAESYWIGDMIRLLPQSTPANMPDTIPTLVMQIRNIVTSFRNLRPEPDNRSVTGDACDSISITLQGSVYTLDSNKKYSSGESIPAELQRADMRNYDRDGYHWRPLSGGNHIDEDNLFAADFPAVISRLYDHEALRSWFPALLSPSPPQLLTLGTDSTLAARSHAAETDERIIGPESTTEETKSWLWSGCRAEALDLATVNGLA
ncbi:MAG: hypothetical protein Q9218_005363, partial [Villophora microphyllina]